MIIVALVLGFLIGVLLGLAISHDIRSIGRGELSESKEFYVRSEIHLEKAKIMNKDSNEKYLEILVREPNRLVNKWPN